jgi:hypothetical protein
LRAGTEAARAALPTWPESAALVSEALRQLVL